MSVLDLDATVGSLPAGVGTRRCSIIVPAYRAYDYLRQSLPSLATAAALIDGECIVCDDGGNGDLAELCRRYGVMLHRHSVTSGPSAARNSAARIAAGDVLLFVDADVVASSGAVVALLQVLESNADISAAFGSYDADPSDRGIVSQYKNLAHHYCHQCGDPSASTFWSGFGAVRRKAFNAVGGFNPRRRFLEDVDLGYRLRRHGFAIRLVPSIQVKHLKPFTLAQWLKSDALERAIPWMQLMAEHRVREQSLNLDWRSKLSAAIASAIGASLLATAVYPSASAILPALVLAFALCNIGWARLCYRARGARFMCCAMVLHWLYFLNATATFAIYRPFLFLGALRTRVRRAPDVHGHLVPSSDGRENRLHECPGGRRILMVDSTRCGGIAHYTYNLCRAIGGIDGLSVKLVTQRRYELANLPKRFDLSAVLVVAATKRSSRAFVERLMGALVEGALLSRNWIAVIWYVVRWRPHVIHFQTPMSINSGGLWCRRWFYDHLMIRILRRCGFPTVVTIHDVFVESFSDTGLKLIMSASGFVIHKPVTFLPPEAADVRFLPHVVIPHPNYTFYAEFATTSAADVRKRLNIPTQARVVLHFGAIVPYKGTDVVIEGFCEYAARDEVVVLVIAGEPADPSYVARVVELSHSAPFSSRIHLDLRYVPLSEVYAYLTMADVVVLPYDATIKCAAGSGVASAALSAGVPLLVSKTDYFLELLAQRWAWVLEERSSGAIARQLNVILGDTAAARTKAYAVKTEFASATFEGAAELSIDLYNRVGPRF
jgi:glycosyltransferase involved in cell wall biosynthesis/GT2 family glycosyltransferase